MFIIILSCSDSSGNSSTPPYKRPRLLLPYSNKTCKGDYGSNADNMQQTHPEEGEGQRSRKAGHVRRKNGAVERKIHPVAEQNDQAAVQNGKGVRQNDRGAGKSRSARLLSRIPLSMSSFLTHRPTSLRALLLGRLSFSLFLHPQGLNKPPPVSSRLSPLFFSPESLIITAPHTLGRAVLDHNFDTPDHHNPDDRAGRARPGGYAAAPWH